MSIHTNHPNFQTAEEHVTIRIMINGAAITRQSQSLNG
jgi:hypothetical protein